jgi:recombinational DNA repair protein RecT
MSQGMTNAGAQPMATQNEQKISTWVQVPEIRKRILSALNNSISPDYFFAQIEISFQDPEVQKCTARSQYESLHRCAAMGLLPSLDQVALIPRRNGSVFELDVMPEWRGYKAIMERHPLVFTVDAQLIHVNDEYTFEDGILKHTFDPFAEDRVIRNVKDIKGGYAIITWRDGRPPKYHFITADYIDKCMSCAQTKNVWTKWFEQMARKTIYNSCYRANHIPVDPAVEAHMGVVIETDNRVLGNDPNRVPSSGAPAALPQGQSRAQLIAQQYLDPEPPRMEQPKVESQDSIPEDNSPNQDGELSDFDSARMDVESAADPMKCKAAFDEWSAKLTDDGDKADLQAVYDTKLKSYPTTPTKGKKAQQGGLPLEA